MDYGPQPNECMYWIARNELCVVIRGNHDDEAAKEGWVKPRRVDEQYWPITLWTRQTLKPDYRERLRGWSEQAPGSNSLGKVLLFHSVPRNPYSYQDTPIADNGNAAWALSLLGNGRRYGLFGHTHFQTLFVKKRRKDQTTLRFAQREDRPESEGSLPVNAKTLGEWYELPECPWLLNPGSVGQPRFYDHADDRAAYALLYSHPKQGLRFNWRRVDYDVAETVRLLEALQWPNGHGGSHSEKGNNITKGDPANDPPDRSAPFNILSAEEREELKKRFPSVVQLMARVLLQGK